METTRYFQEQVLRKRGYLHVEWCEAIVQRPIASEIQPDGRIRFWGAVPELNGKVVRVVTLADGQTIHNAFLDRNFRNRPGGESP